MIVFLHNLADEQLEAYKLKLREIFARAGQEFSEITVRFERCDASRARGWSGAVSEIECITAGSALDEATNARLAAGFFPRESAWQRRNRGAPWYRQFQAQRRR